MQPNKLKLPDKASPIGNIPPIKRTLKLEILNNLLTIAPQGTALSSQESESLGTENIFLSHSRSQIYALVIDYINQHPTKKIVNLELADIPLAKGVNLFCEKYFNEIKNALLNQSSHYIKDTYREPLEEAIVDFTTKIYNYTKQKEQDKQHIAGEIKNLTTEIETGKIKLMLNRDEIVQLNQEQNILLTKLREDKNILSDLLIKTKEQEDEKSVLITKIKSYKDLIESTIIHHEEKISSYLKNEVWGKMSSTAMERFRGELQNIHSINNVIKVQLKEAFENVRSNSSHTIIEQYLKITLEKLKNKSTQLHETLSKLHSIETEKFYFQELEKIYSQAEKNPGPTAAISPIRDQKKIDQHYKNMLELHNSEKEGLKQVIDLNDRTADIIEKNLNKLDNFSDELKFYRTDREHLQHFQHEIMDRIDIRNEENYKITKKMDNLNLLNTRESEKQRLREAELNVISCTKI